MKKCSYCAEEIQDEAIKCKHCGEFLNGSRPSSVEPNGLPWYFRTSAIVVALLTVGPLALPMIWWHPRLGMIWKILITAGTLGLTWAMYQTTVEAFKMLKDIEKTMQGI